MHPSSTQIFPLRSALIYMSTKIYVYISTFPPRAALDRSRSCRPSLSSSPRPMRPAAKGASSCRACASRRRCTESSTTATSPRLWMLSSRGAPRNWRRQVGCVSYSLSLLTYIYIYIYIHIYIYVYTYIYIYTHININT